MLKHVLAVTCAEMEPSKDRNDAGVKVIDAAFVCRLLALFFHNLTYFLLCLCHGFLDFCRLDSSVQNKIFKGDPSDLPPDRIKTGKNNGAGCVIHDDINAGCPLKRLNISAFLADNFSFNLVGGGVSC